MRGCVRAYPKTGGEFLLKQTPVGERAVGASGGDVLAVPGYGEVVKREFAREGFLPLLLPSLDPRRVSRGPRPPVYVSPEADRSQDTLFFSVSSRRGVAGVAQRVARLNACHAESIRNNEILIITIRT